MTLAPDWVSAMTKAVPHPLDETDSSLWVHSKRIVKLGTCFNPQMQSDLHKKRQANRGLPFFMLLIAVGIKQQ